MSDDSPARGEPIANPLFEVWRLARRTEAVMDAEMADVTTASDFALYSLLRSLGSTTATELAGVMTVGMSTVSQQLRRLERRGHLERRPNPDDGRSWLVSLTGAGLAQHDRASPAFGELRDRLRDELADDHDLVMWGMRRLDEALCRLLDVELPDTVPLPVVDTVPLPATSLDAGQVREVQDFVAWLRWRDGTPAVRTDDSTQPDHG